MTFELEYILYVGAIAYAASAFVCLLRHELRIMGFIIHLLTFAALIQLINIALIPFDINPLTVNLWKYTWGYIPFYSTLVYNYMLHDSWIYGYLYLAGYLIFSLPVSIGIAMLSKRDRIITKLIPQFAISALMVVRLFVDPHFVLDFGGIILMVAGGVLGAYIGRALKRAFSKYIRRNEEASV